LNNNLKITVMGHTKIVSRILYIAAMAASLCYLLTVLYSVICLLTGWSVQQQGNGLYLHILVPFTQQPFLVVDNNLPYIIFSFLLPLTLYGLFFWLAANVFRIFFQQKLFTQPHFRHLVVFCATNLIVPLIAVFTARMFVDVENEMWMLVAVHFVLGLFAYFLAGIFRQGLELQNEKDLFI